METNGLGQASEDQREAYEAPRVETLGTVAELTAGAGNGGTDGMTGAAAGAHS